MIDYWLDFIEEMRKYMTLSEYLFYFIGKKGYKGKIPSVKFWAITFLAVIALNHIGIKLFCYDGEITPEVCIKELEKCWSGNNK